MPVLSAVSVGAYWYDKRMAKQKGWRVPEATLLMWDALGGWPGGWWAQQKFRHKTQKTSFRLKYFGAIVVNLVLLYLIFSGKLDWSGLLKATEGTVR